MFGYSAVIGVAAVTTFLLAFVVRRNAARWDLVVPPDERRIHARPTASSGGIAMYGGFAAAMLAALALPQFRPVFSGSSMPIGVVLAATVITVVGFVDDRREVSPPAKVAGQVLAGAVMAYFGVTMLFLRIPFAETVVLSNDLAPLATVVWLIIIANAINLIDGLDGLAAGIVGIAALSFFIYGSRRFDVGLLDGPANLAPLVAAIALGVCLGFLPHNFHPARIFMGDSGALLLGLLLATASLVMTGQSDDQFSGGTFFFFAPVFIPFVILGIPVLDTAMAIFRRTRRRTGFATADKEHLHHRLMRLGHGQRRAVLILWGWTAVLSALVLIPTYVESGNAWVPAGIAVLALVLMLYTSFNPGAGRTPPPPPVDFSRAAVEEDSGTQPDLVALVEGAGAAEVADEVAVTGEHPIIR